MTAGTLIWGVVSLQKPGLFKKPGFFCVLLLTVEQKANHVGGVVVLEMAFVQFVNRNVIDQCDTDFGTDRLFGGKRFGDDIVQ